MGTPTNPFQFREVPKGVDQTNDASSRLSDAAQEAMRDVQVTGDAANKEASIANLKKGAQAGRTMVDDMFAQLQAQTPESQKQILSMLMEGLPTAEQANMAKLGKEFPLNEQVKDPSEITVAWAALSKKFQQISDSSIS